MQYQEYITERNRLFDEALIETPVSDNEMFNRTVNFVSANLSNFIPEMDFTEHEPLFRQILLYQKLSRLDAEYANIYDSVSMEDLSDDLLAMLKSQPAIICSFHFGSIRLINYFLANNFIKFSLVISDSALEDYKGLYKNIYKQYEAYPGDDGFNIISAQSPNSGLQMLRELKKGHSLLLYIDGNSGAGNDSIKNENRVKIDFLAETIYARKGIGYISHLANVPIVVAANYRRSVDDIRIKFFDPVFPDQEMDRETYANLATQKIYSIFSDLLVKYPHQWEAWLYLHTVIKPAEFKEAPFVGPALIDSTRLIFNKKRYGLFNIGNDLFLFNKRTYSSYKLDIMLYGVLTIASRQPVNRDEFSETIAEQLIANGVLIS
jgi:lauroyl/myristoyl acyltransferase